MQSWKWGGVFGSAAAQGEWIFFFFDGWWYTVSLYHLVRWMSHEGIYLFTDILGEKLKVLCHSLSQQLSLSCRKLWKMHFLFLLRKKKKDVKTNQKTTEDSALSLFQLNKPKTHIDFPTGKASDWYVESRQHQTPPAVAALQKCGSICQKPGGHCSCFQKSMGAIGSLINSVQRLLRWLPWEWLAYIGALTLCFCGLGANIPEIPSVRDTWTAVRLAGISPWWAGAQG